MLSVKKALLSDFSEADFVKEYNNLTAEDKKRFSLMRPKNKRQSLACRILLRRELKRIYGVDSYNFTKNENGKPLLGFCYFSLSHSDNLAVCAVSDKPIGIDAEFIKSVPFRPDYRLFNLDEVIYVNAEKDKHDLRFFEVWTKKEAYIKAKGLKLADTAGVNVLSALDAELTYEIYGDYIVSLCELT